MPLKDKFSYSKPGFSDHELALSCCFCKYFQGPEKWPDINEESKCLLHKVKLNYQLSKTKYMGDGYFCKYFEDAGRSYPLSTKELNTIRDSLSEGIIYGAYGKDGYLQEKKISDLEKIK